MNIEDVQEEYEDNQEADIGRKQTTHRDKEYRVHQVSQPAIDPFASRILVHISYLNKNDKVRIAIQDNIHLNETWTRIRKNVAEVEYLVDSFRG